MAKKVVYIVNDRAPLVRDALLERGFEVLVGSGEPLNGEYLARCWALMPGRAHITEEVLDRAPHLKLICKQGVGVDRIDTAACSRRGIRVANTPHSNAVSVAEHTMALILACAKQLYPISKSIRGGEPDAGCAQRWRSCELAGKTLAVIGFGNIGSRVAKMAVAFDMRVVACVRKPEKYQDVPGVEFTGSLEKALGEADFVSVHVAGTEENRHLIGEKELALMKPGAYLINTTRGFVVDEHALYQALTSGRLAGAGLDVFEHEPLRPGELLLTLDNVFATPHTAANTPESNRRAHLQCIEIISSFAEE